MAKMLSITKYQCRMLSVQQLKTYTPRQGPPLVEINDRQELLSFSSSHHPRSFSSPLSPASALFQQGRSQRGGGGGEGALLDFFFSKEQS